MPPLFCMKCNHEIHPLVISPPTTLRVFELAKVARVGATRMTQHGLHRQQLRGVAQGKTVVVLQQSLNSSITL